MKFSTSISLDENKSALWDRYLLGFCVVVTLLIPAIKLSDTFYLSIEEILFPIIAIRLMQMFFLVIDKVVMTALIFAVLILVSILINAHKTSLNEYFEGYKVGKYIIVYLYTLFCFQTFKSFELVHRFVKSLFVVIVIFNLLHYVDAFGFNNSITILYDTNGIDLQYFGKNSEGGVGAKRMFGTMGNPNMNAILFLFFFSYFNVEIHQAHKRELEKRMNQVFMIISAILIILCQSRTGLITFAVVYFISWYFRSFSLKDALLEIMIISGFYFLVHLGDPESVQYVSNTSSNLGENNSVKGRKAMWLYLIEMWKQKPIFGYGPNKNFMYANGIHPESQYLFYLWRYGVIGCCVFVAWLMVPFVVIRKNFSKYAMLVFTTIIILITSVMSNPIDNSKIVLIYTIVIGLSMAKFYYGLDDKKVMDE